MALSGTINGTTNNPEILCRIDWTATQSAVNNSSTITAILRYWRTNEGYTTMGNFRGGITINGVEVLDDSSQTISFTYNSYTEVMRATVVVPHNTDGTKSVSISASGKINSTSLDATYLSGTITLNQIERKATITSASNFNDEGNPTIKYKNPAGSAVESLQACISLDGTATSIDYRDISKTGTSYTFNLTSAERNILRNGTTTSNTKTIYFFVRTVIGGEKYYSSLAKTLTIVNCAPTINPSVYDSNSITTALTGDNNKFIKYYSNAAYTIEPTPLKYSTITSVKAVCGNRQSTTANGTLNAIESGSFTFSAKDSRGNLTSKTVSKTLVNYVKLTCNMTIGAPTTDGNLSFTISGNYFNGSFGAVANTLTVQYRYKTNSGSYSSWTAATATKNGNKYTASVSLTGLDYRNTYTFQSRAIDKLATKNSAEKPIKTTPVFDWGANDLAINVPLTVNVDGETALYITGDNTSKMLQSLPTYNRTYNYSPNLYITSVGTFGRSTSSSQRYKTDIEDVVNEELNPFKILDIPVRQYKYNADNIPVNQNGDGLCIGLIAEEVEKAFPAAAEYNESGEVEMWNIKVLFPALLKVVQQQQKEIEALKAGRVE